MSKSIKEIGKKVESKLSSEVAKKETEMIKEAISSLPTGAKVRVLKLEDGVKKYITTVPIDEYDKTDPYAWLKRRFARKYGGGEYILEFISSDGEIIQQSSPIVIETEEEPEKQIIKEEEEFLKKINEALKIKEEAIEQKQKLAEEKAQVETEKAKTVIELAEKQIDMITKLYEEKIRIIEERFKKSDHDDKEILLLMTELNKLRDEYMMAIQNIERTIENIKNEQQQPQYMDMLMQFMLQSIQKDSFEDMMKMVTFLKELQPKEEKKDFFEELIENPTKYEMFKRLMGLDAVEEMRKEMIDIMRYTLESQEHKEEKKDVLEEALESFEKLKRLKDILAPALGIQPQPAKSFLELISTILQSPQIPQIVQALAQSMTQTRITEKMIEMGYVPADLAQQFVKIDQAQGFSGARPQQQVQQKVQKIEQQPQKEDEIKMFKDTLKQIIASIVPNMKGNETNEQFAKMLADKLIKVGEANKMLAATIIFMNKENRKKAFVETLQEINPEIPNEMAEEIYEIVEKQIEEYIKQKL